MYKRQASLLPAVLFAIAGVAVLYAIQLVLVPEDGASMFTRIVWGNFISPVIVGIFLVSMLLLLDKRRRLNSEKRTSNLFLQEIGPRLLDDRSQLEEITASASFTDNLLAHRWQQSKLPENENSRSFGENEIEHLQNSYSVPRFFVWALPIVGFVGTVWGIGLSISFFSDTMAAGQSGTSVSTMLQQNIPLVTKGLSTAFDTTLLALALSLPATGFLVITERDERDYLLKLDEHWRSFSASRYDPTDELSHLNDEQYAHAQAVGESLRDEREEAFAHREQRLHYRD